MSDPNDPYRDAFGIGSIGGGLEKEFGEEAISQLTKTEEVLVSIANQLSGIAKSLEGFKDITKTVSEMANKAGSMGKGLEKLKPVAKEMTKSKFAKATKGLKGMFGSMAGALGSASPIMLLMNTLKPLMALFKPFQVILDLIGMLLKVMVGEALKPMFEALQPLFDAFIEFIPFFVELGGIVGRILTAVLKPLISLFIMLMPVIMPIIIAIMELIEMALVPLMGLFEDIMPIIIAIIDIALIPLKMILQILKPIFKALAPLFETIGEVLKPLEPVIIMFGHLVGVVLWTAFKVVVMAIAWFIDVISVGFAGAVNKATKFLADIERDMAGEGTSSRKIIGTSEEAVAAKRRRQEEVGEVRPLGYKLRVEEGLQGGLQEGGFVLSQGIYELAEENKGEVVIPLTKWEKSISTQTSLLSSMNDELVSLAFYNREILKEKKSKRIFERMRGRR